MVSCRGSYRSNEHIPTPPTLTLTLILALVTQPQNPQHSITPRRRKDNHPHSSLAFSAVDGVFNISTCILHNPPKHRLKVLPHSRLIDNQLLNPNPFLSGKNTCFVHERFGDDITALFADKEEEGEFPCPSPSLFCSLLLLAVMVTIVMVKYIMRQVFTIPRLRTVDSGMREMCVDKRR